MDWMLKAPPACLTCGYGDVEARRAVGTPVTFVREALAAHVDDDGVGIAEEDAQATGGVDLAAGAGAHQVIENRSSFLVVDLDPGFGAEFQHQRRRGHDRLASLP